MIRPLRPQGSAEGRFLSGSCKHERIAAPPKARPRLDHVATKRARPKASQRGQGLTLGRFPTFPADSKRSENAQDHVATKRARPKASQRGQGLTLGRFPTFPADSKRSENAQDHVATIQARPKASQRGQGLKSRCDHPSLAESVATRARSTQSPRVEQRPRHLGRKHFQDLRAARPRQRPHPVHRGRSLQRVLPPQQAPYVSKMGRVADQHRPHPPCAPCSNTFRKPLENPVYPLRRPMSLQESAK
jgi:hypothetical protein